MSLVPLAYDPDSATTYFTDQSGSYNVPYTSTGGLATLQPQTVAIAPEPSSALTAISEALAFVTFGWVRRRVRRRSA